MRNFDDRQGRSWEVVVGRESWGALLAIFVPSGWDGVARQSMLEAVDRAAAARELEAMNQAELEDLLGRSRPKET